MQLTTDAEGRGRIAGREHPTNVFGRESAVPRPTTELVFVPAHTLFSCLQLANINRFLTCRLVVTYGCCQSQARLPRWKSSKVSQHGSTRRREPNLADGQIVGDSFSLFTDQQTGMTMSTCPSA